MKNKKDFDWKLVDSFSFWLGLLYGGMFVLLTFTIIKCWEFILK